ncbi:hypothetical protein [Natronococcus sp.]|uniref:hypothetical protein n=1 Tax=Natronococcus sp. TaxID=35747 RepID=UPI0025E6A7C8|nr:hypothetical protein [Natronococcus sp.]
MGSDDEHGDSPLDREDQEIGAEIAADPEPLLSALPFSVAVFVLVKRPHARRTKGEIDGEESGDWKNDE